MKEKLKKSKGERNNQKSHITLHTSHNSGISLVALIITTIVLLILAVVAIRAVQGDGIIGHAKNAKTEYEKMQEEEALKLLEYDLKLAKETGADTSDILARVQALEWVKSATESDGILTIEGSSGNQYELSLESGTIQNISEFKYPFDVKLAYVNKFVYRIGNQNAVSLDSLFKVVEGKDIAGKTLYLTIYDESGNELTSTGAISATYNKKITGDTWNSETVQFKGTGKVVLKIGTSKYRTDLTLDIVDGVNVTNFLQIRNLIKNLNITKNVVLLSDITIDTNSFNYETQYTVNNQLPQFLNSTLYGNGFTIHAETLPNPDSNNRSTFGILRLNNANIDRVVLKGATFPEIDYYSDDDYSYFISGIVMQGTAQITNSYIYGCREPIRVDSGDATISNSIIDGGVYTNIKIYNCNTLNLDNVITIQNPYTATVGTDLTKKVMGGGIFVESKATNATINMNNTYQYNWINKDDPGNYLKLTSYDSIIFSKIFATNGNYTEWHHNVNDTIYVNTGIVTSGEGTTPIINVNNNTYSQYKFALTIFGKDLTVYGYVASPIHLSSGCICTNTLRPSQEQINNAIVQAICGQNPTIN